MAGAAGSPGSTSSSAVRYVATAGRSTLANFGAKGFADLDYTEIGFTA